GVAIVETCGSKLAVPQEATVEVVFPKQRIIGVCGHRSEGPPHHVDTGRIDSDGTAVIPSGGPELTDPQNLGAGLTTRAWCGDQRRGYRKRRQEAPTIALKCHAIRHRDDNIFSGRKGLRGRFRPVRPRPAAENRDPIGRGPLPSNRGGRRPGPETAYRPSEATRPEPHGPFPGRSSLPAERSSGSCPV